jgi:hypothetical protein
MIKVWVELAQARRGVLSLLLCTLVISYMLFGDGAGLNASVFRDHGKRSASMVKSCGITAASFQMKIDSL